MLLIIRIISTFGGKFLIMKTKLLGLFLSIGLFTWAQSPIQSFYVQENSMYKIVLSATGIDQSPSGANAIWNYSDLLEAGSAIEKNQTPTSAEITTYPNSNKVTINSSTIGTTTNDTKLFSKNTNNQVSITGLNNPYITLNFGTNNALVGTYPMNYGYTNSDTMAGTYVYGTYNGTFTGTINTSVDAYGTLNLTIDGVSSSHSVTRFKAVQNISLNYSIFPNVGTIVQTIYNYYEAGNTSPIFRSTISVVNVPLQGITDETTITLEKFDGVLSNNTFVATTSFAYPNPMHDRLYLNVLEEVQKITITDVRGRIVKSISKPEQMVDVSTLENGLYLLEIQSAQGIQIQKILKN